MKPNLAGLKSGRYAAGNKKWVVKKNYCLSRNQGFITLLKLLKHLTQFRQRDKVNFESASHEFFGRSLNKIQRPASPVFLYKCAFGSSLTKIKYRHFPIFKIMIDLNTHICRSVKQDFK